MKFCHFLIYNIYNIYLELTKLFEIICKIKLKEKGAVITPKLAERFNLKIGDGQLNNAFKNEGKVFCRAWL